MKKKNIARTIIYPMLVIVLVLILIPQVGTTAHRQIDEELKNETIILVDDVLNSGRTMMYGLQLFLRVPVKKLSTAVLINRSHKRFPVNADYVGMSLATTLKEHIEVSLESGKFAVYLS